MKIEMTLKEIMQIKEDYLNYIKQPTYDEVHANYLRSLFEKE